MICMPILQVMAPLRALILTWIDKLDILKINRTIIGKYHLKKSIVFFFYRMELFLMRMYILIEKYTTFSLKSIPLIKSNQLLWSRSSNTKQDDKYGFETRDYKALFTRG